MNLSSSASQVLVFRPSGNQCCVVVPSFCMSSGDVLLRKSWISSSHRLNGRDCFREAGRVSSNSGDQCAMMCDHLLAVWLATRFAQRHLRRK